MAKLRTEYLKTPDGCVETNCGGAIVPGPTGDAAAVAARNHGPRVFIPAAKTFQVVVQVGQIDHVILDGATAAPTSLLLRIRAESGAAEPPPPAAEVAHG